MKKTIALFLVTFVFAFALVGCSGSSKIPDGTYTMTGVADGLGIGNTFTVKGSTMTIPIYGVAGVDYTYKIDGKEIKLTAQGASLSYSYEKKGNIYIIGGVEYIQGNVSANSNEDDYSDSSTVLDDYTAEISPTPPNNASLNLPIVAVDNVYMKGPSTGTTYGAYYITESGNLIYSHGSANDIIDTDVRSVHIIAGSILYLKADNTLWGFGSNNVGQLGDGTGVDRDSPIKIMDDVATFGTGDSIMYGYYRVYAIKTDCTYWVWGAAYDGSRSPFDIVYEPVQIATNIVRFIDKGDGSSLWMQDIDFLIQTGDGYFYDAKIFSAVEGNSLTWDFLPNVPIRDLAIFAKDSGKRHSISQMPINEHHLYWIDSDNVLWTRPIDSDLNVDEKVAENVDKILKCGSDESIFFISTDETLYGLGNNSYGQLGDGTKVNRDELVKIADNVVAVNYYAFIKSNGELWTWDSENPTPNKCLDDAVYFLDSSYVLLQDGSIFNRYASVSDNFILTNVKIPETTIYNP